MERDFLPEKDSQWLDGLLKNFGKEADQLSSHEPQFDDSELENLSQEDLEKAAVVQFYFIIHYPPHRIQTPENLDKAALEMMRTLAYFLENGYINTTNEIKRRVGDVYPDLSVRHGHIAARLNLKDANEKLTQAITGSEEFNYQSTRQSYFTALSLISRRAMEFEEKRKKN